MKIFFDTEFIEDGKTIELISIGAIAEDGRTFYAENSEVDLSKANDFVKKFVIPELDDSHGFTKADIKKDFVNFCGYHPEFWADYCSYDWIVLCQLFGSMMKLPKDWPMYCNDIQTFKLLKRVGDFPYSDYVAHNALNDAKEVKARYEYLEGK